MGAGEDAAFFVSYEGEEWPVGVSFSCKPTGNTWRAGWATRPTSTKRQQAKLVTPTSRQKDNTNARKRLNRNPKSAKHGEIGVTDSEDTALRTPDPAKKRSAPGRRRNTPSEGTSASKKVPARQPGASTSASATGLLSQSMRARLEWFDVCQERAAENVAKGDPRRSYLPYLKPGTAVWNEAMRLFYEAAGKPSAVASKSDSNGFGEIPGVPVGTLVISRSRLMVLNLHRPIMAGIDYVSRRNAGGRMEPWGVTSIIESGGYEDDEDTGDVLWYTGQGANDLQGDHKQVDNQKLVRGNLAFANMLQRRARGLDVSPVRVIRGYDRKSKVLTGVAADAKPTIHDGTAKAFVYSGLFDCVEMKTEWNRDHHRIYKFKLVKRVTVTSVSDPNSTIAKGARRQILSDQIVSQPTQVPNFQGSVERKRKAFKHRVDAASGKRIKYNGVMHADISDGTEPWRIPAINTVDTSEWGKGMGFRYTSVVLPSREAESLLAPGSRTITHQQKRAETAGRLAYPIAVFRTSDGRGWGGQASTCIPKGSFVCSYVGELITRAESDARNDSLYLMDIDEEYSIDSSSRGNMSRFFNHSCAPNLEVRQLDNWNVPHWAVGFFSTRTIKKGEELTYSYGSNYVRDTREPGVFDRKCLCGGGQAERWCGNWMNSL